MSGVYVKAREKFLRGEVSWTEDDVAVVLVTSAYIPDFNADEYLSDVVVGARVAMSNALEDKTATGGWASSPQIVWDDVVGAACAALVVIADTGDAATSPLLAYLDEGITNLPLTPNGAKITLIPDPDTGLFRL